MENGYQIRLLGTVQVVVGAEPVRDFASRKSLALLGYLIRQEGPVSRSHLADLFWPDNSESRGRRNLSELWKYMPWPVAFPLVGNSCWFEDVVGRHIAVVAATLPPELVEAAQERGRTRDGWAMAEELLEQLKST